MNNFLAMGYLYNIAVVVHFFLFGTFSFFVGVVENLYGLTTTRCSEFTISLKSGSLNTVYVCAFRAASDEIISPGFRGMHDPIREIVESVLTGLPRMNRNCGTLNTPGSDRISNLLQGGTVS